MFILYSVFLKTNSAETNQDLYNTEKRFLKDLGVPFTETRGTYEGVLERSFLVDRAFSNIIKTRAWQARQECVLVVNDENAAFLSYTNGNIRRLGTWQEVTDEYSGDYTIVRNRKYSVK